MPKMKSKGAVKVRFRVSKSGKVKSNRPGRGHMRASKSAKARRRLRTPIIFPDNWGKMIRKMLGK